MARNPVRYTGIRHAILDIDVLSEPKLSILLNEEAPTTGALAWLNI